MKKTIKLSDYLKAAGVYGEDKKQKDEEFDKMFDEALKNTDSGKRKTRKAEKTPNDDNAEDRNAVKVRRTANAADIKYADFEGGGSGENKESGSGNRDSGGGAEDNRTVLENELNDLKKEYESKTKRTFNGTTIEKYIPKEFKGKTDEEIETEANEKYSPKAEREKTELERKSKKAEEKLAAGLLDIDEEKDKLIGNLRAQLSDDYEKTKNSAVKRGLGRSSILDGEVEALADGFAADKAGAEQSAGKKKEKIADEIADIKDELYYAIKNLDEETAEKIRNEIKSLAEKRDAEKEKVDEYNKTQERKYKDKLDEIEKDGLKYDEKLTDEYAAYYGESFRKIFNYYRSFGENAKAEAEKDKDFIVSHIDEDGYKNLLGYL